MTTAGRWLPSAAPRQPIELERLAATCLVVGMRTLATVTGDVDLGDDDGMFSAGMYAAFAAKESGRRSAGVRRKTQANAAQGRPHGGEQRPFGYEADKVTVRPDEAAVIGQLVGRYLAGASLGSLCTWLAHRRRVVRRAAVSR